MIVLKLAFRTLLGRRSRMMAIGALVAFGTLLLVLGETFTRSARQASRESIIDNFTGDFIIYSAQSRETPSPFAFQTPLPNIRNLKEIEALLAGLPEVEAFVPYAQNYAIIQVERAGDRVEMPFVFYAVEPVRYRKVFHNARMVDGEFFGAEEGGPVAAGIVISAFQNRQYRDSYGVTLQVGEAVTVLGLTGGGSVNAVASRLAGIFEPRTYANVFNYINFMDAGSYSTLYNFTGVRPESLPAGFNQGLERAARDEDSLFALADQEGFGELDLSTLSSQALSGYTMIAVKLHDHNELSRVMAAVDAAAPGGGDLEISVASWEEASGLFARIASGLQAFIYLATGLVFLVVVFIFMNTLIINIVERTAEIGTIRAIGGGRSFVRALFLAETLILNLTFSLLAMAVSLVLLLALRGGGLPLPETIAQFLIGGGSLPLSLSVVPFLQALGIVAAASAIATVYPIRVATSITPLRAMNER